MWKRDPPDQEARLRAMDEREAELKLRERERKLGLRRGFPTTSKLIMAYIITDFTIIQIYSMWVMVYLRDISALYSLITAILGEFGAWAVYAMKAYAETREEKKMELENKKFAADQSGSEEAQG